MNQHLYFCSLWVCCEGEGQAMMLFNYNPTGKSHKTHVANVWPHQTQKSDKFSNVFLLLFLDCSIYCSFLIVLLVDLIVTSKKKLAEF